MSEISSKSIWTINPAFPANKQYTIKNPLQRIIYFRHYENKVVIVASVWSPKFRSTSTSKPSAIDILVEAKNDFIITFNLKTGEIFITDPENKSDGSDTQSCSGLSGSVLPGDMHYATALKALKELTRKARSTPGIVLQFNRSNPHELKLSNSQDKAIKAILNY